MNEPDFPPNVAELLSERRVNPLDAGTPNQAMFAKLRGLTPELLLQPHSIANRDMAKACLSGLWLYHNFLDESHTISQSIDTPTGSFWHAIMHRRETDFSNSAYWFRRVGRHPVFVSLGQAAAESLSDHLAATSCNLLTDGDTWDPFAFLDLCEGAYRKRNTYEDLCRQMQQLEWQLLFQYCLREALGNET